MKPVGSNACRFCRAVVRINIYADIQPCGGRPCHILGKAFVFRQSALIMGPACADNGKIDSRRFDLLPVYRPVNISHINSILHDIFPFVR